MTFSIKDLDKSDLRIAKAAIKAMDQGRAIPVLYDGMLRLVEVHAVGVTTAGNPCMRVFQVAGETRSGEELGWKMMTFEKVQLIDDVNSEAPRPGYKKGDKGMGTIFKEVETVV